MTSARFPAFPASSSASSAVKEVFVSSKGLGLEEEEVDARAEEREAKSETGSGRLCRE